ncbi:Predicted Zn-dependent peptidase [Malonomonas rubra DSM 5091]|uniref:Predicted Zn-dependent peptidase n=1 Tax=Malonomonas rubra DSM 5091 TaxID=1122189 RepID=A0A1M6KGJ9_MALRU|nr:pitrilysin family protein [Malonomonas rubra]SHJ58041.1 Predicted Zn-dependent peptidase [Malonomonas rubra DSM 5091]
MLQQSTLNNGIRVITERMPELHSASIGFWVQNGSRHETEGHNGISHFVEHMLFRGTTNRFALDIAKEIDSVGGVLNAFTGREFSCYYAKVLGDKLPQAIDLLSDLVLNSIFSEKDIEKERRVILQELAMVEDTPDDQVHDLFCESIWHLHPLGRPVLGTRDTVRRISREDLLQMMQKRYVGRNILIAVAGDLEHHQVRAQIEQAFQGVNSGEANNRCTLPAYRPGLQVVHKELEQVHFCLGCKALPQNHEDRFVQQLLNSILGGSMSSRLFQKVREEHGLAYSVYSYLNVHSDAGALVVYGGTSRDELWETVQVTLEQFALLKAGQVSEEELQMAKEQLKGTLLMSLESSDNRMTR